MYELLNNCTSDMVYHNDNIKITMSLTGKILPLETTVAPLNKVPIISK